MMRTKGEYSACIICLGETGTLHSSSSLVAGSNCACVYDVHLDCLVSWLERSTEPRCVVCGQETTLIEKRGVKELPVSPHELLVFCASRPDPVGEVPARPPDPPDVVVVHEEADVRPGRARGMPPGYTCSWKCCRTFWYMVVLILVVMALTFRRS